MRRRLGSLHADATHATATDRRTAAAVVLTLDWLAGIEALSIVLLVDGSLKPHESITCMACLILVGLFATFQCPYSAGVFAIFTSFAFCAAGSLTQQTHHWTGDAALSVIFLICSVCIVHVIDKLRDLQATLHNADRANQQLSRRVDDWLEIERLSRTGTFSWDARSGAIRASDELCSIVGLDRRRLSVRQLLRQVHPADRRRVWKLLATLATGVAPRETTFCLIPKPNQFRHVRIAIGAVSPLDSAQIRVGSLADISEWTTAQREEMANRLQAADELKTGCLDELSAAMAHEIVQPLSSLVMDGQACLRWLRHENPPKDEIQECVERMTSDGRRASATLKKIRDLIRRPPPELRPVELNRLLLSILDDLGPDLRASGIRLRLNLSNTLPTVVADEHQLRLVVLNVCVNAIEAMQLAGHRENELDIVSRTYPDGRVGFLVRDNGAGIRIAPTEQIFEPFVGDKARRLGLGLAVCRSIVEAHDGLITAMNNSANGATLVITFAKPLS